MGGLKAVAVAVATAVSFDNFMAYARCLDFYFIRIILMFILL